jgi:hypothetical protein
VNICTELWALETIAGYAVQQVHAILSPRATATATFEKWLAVGRVAAVRSGAYSLSSNRVDPTGTCGGAGWILDPDGRLLALTSADEPFATATSTLPSPPPPGRPTRGGVPLNSVRTVAGVRSRQKKGLLTRVTGQRGRRLELGSRFCLSAGPEQTVAPRRRQGRKVAQGRGAGDLVQEPEASFGPERHAVSDRSIEIHHG